MDKQYTLADVSTSLNCGRPLTQQSKRLVFTMFVIMLIMLAILVVVAVVCVATGEIPTSDLWIFAPVLAVSILVIVIIKWLLARYNKIEKQMQDSLLDAIPTRGVLRYESHVFNDGSSFLTYVVYFSIEGADYAVVPNNRSNSVNNNRKDLSYFVDKTCNILYSPKHNDVLVLKPKSDEEIM